MSKKKRNKIEKCNERIIQIDYLNIEKAIIEANKKIKDIEIKEKVDMEKEEQEEWDKIMYYKYCPNKKSFVLKFLYELRNTIVSLLVVISFKKKNANSPRVIFNLLRQLLISMFGLCEWVLYFFVGGSIYHLICKGGNKLIILFAIFMFLFARIFRVIKFEVENIKEQSLLIGIFSTITSFVAMIVAIIALIN